MEEAEEEAEAVPQVRQLLPEESVVDKQQQPRLDRTEPGEEVEEEEEEEEVRAGRSRHLLGLRALWAETGQGRHGSLGLGRSWGSASTAVPAQRVQAQRVQGRR